MRRTTKTIVSIMLASALAGCAATPNVEEMTTLPKNEVLDLLAGNTLRSSYDWGQWTEFFNEDMSVGDASAKGSGFNEVASSTTTVSDEGEVCSIYSGPYEWSKPDIEYCGKMLRDANGSYYHLVTKQPRKPERIGQLDKFTVAAGDPYELSN